jgi:hypothetical protein
MKATEITLIPCENFDRSTFFSPRLKPGSDEIDFSKAGSVQLPYHVDLSKNYAAIHCVNYQLSS